VIPIVKRKRALSETSTTIILDGSDETEAEEARKSIDLLATLQEIRKYDKVIGFILRSPNRATVFLRDNEEISKYAILSSQLFDSSEQVLELFDLGNTENILIEGKNIKVLCINLDEKMLSIFMERNADHTEILNMILPPTE
jgi:predicted regulator of Ras-like GTPase activity (Roadblock/LC7/MglB family)